MSDQAPPSPKDPVTRIKDKLNQLIREFKKYANETTEAIHVLEAQVAEKQDTRAAHRMQLIKQIDTIQRRLDGNVYAIETPDHRLLDMLKRELALAQQ